VTDVEEPGSRLARHRRRRRRFRTVVGGGVVLAVLAAIALAGRGFGFGGTEEPRPASTNLPPATAKVSRATLTETERITGTLGYGAATTITARAGGTGTITWLPPAGTVVRPGDPLYKVDNNPVVLLRGDLPLYRTLADTVEGPDVKELETNLRALGYRGFTVDAKFTQETVTAVKKWQKKLGLAETGTVEPAQVVVAPGELRVAGHKVTAGAEVTGPILTCTGTTRVITVALEVTRQHLVRVGLTATITLPDGKTTAGTVAGIGTVATSPAAATGPGDPGGPGNGQAGPATVEVIVTVADQAALGTLDAAPVELTLIASERKDVLTVPVGALVALAEGGYGVQVVDGTRTRYLTVHTGMFADGKVEVSGDGIAEGVVVGVPA
jgi:peptidoglycan hydrolase-like protein with peptidoglycan-binding domain